MAFKNSTTFIKRISVVIGLVIAFSNGAFADLEDDIRARISPAGEVCVFGEECAASVAVTNTGSGEPLEPQEVYDTFCFACHGTGVNNAPVLGDAVAWAPRLEKGMDVLIDSAVNGFNNNAMPARGLCASCSDDDLRATVELMIEAIQ